MQLQLPSATLNFCAQAKTGPAHTINKLQLSQDWQVQSDFFDTHTVHTN